MRPISQEVYGIPRERVIGSATALEYTVDEHGGTITHKAEADYLDDGPQKPIRIWSRTGRRPLLAAGNSNGDIPMLDFTHHPDQPCLRLLVLHDDAEREFSYTGGAEEAFAKAATRGWTVVSISSDWARVFSSRPSAQADPRRVTSRHRADGARAQYSPSMTKKDPRIPTGASSPTPARLWRRSRSRRPAAPRPPSTSFAADPGEARRPPSARRGRPTSAHRFRICVHRA